MNNILLVLRSGGQYNLKDVLLLSHHLHEKINDVKVYCITNGIKTKIELSMITLLPMQYEWNGWWSKMNMFSPDLNNLYPFLYLDLDTAFIFPITILDRYRDGFIMLRDFYRNNKAASGIMYLPANNKKTQLIWETWIKQPNIWMQKLRGDQEFINFVTIPDFYFQDICEGIISYKQNKKAHHTELKGNEKIICFHGKPKIPELVGKVDWVTKYFNYV